MLHRPPATPAMSCFGLPIAVAVTVCLLASYVQAQQRPNILIVMVDDLGYSDLGCYGSEIDTPHLDRLADGGLRFSQFYNTAKCHSSRVSLLTGQYCIAAGDTAMTHAVTSAEVLRAAGYFTAMTGKWHLKKEPTDFGFDRYFGHLSGACNYFSGDNTFRLNGNPYRIPDSGFYTTVANVDYSLQFLDEARQSEKPWFLYVAFNAPHAPLHALPDDYAKYKGRYDDGWDVIRARRAEKQKQIGILPESLRASPRPEHIPAWEAMEPWRQKYEANRMTTLAAMIDRVDQEVGRLVADLTANNELENTLIVFVSDNGACPYDRKAPLLDVEPTSGDVSLADSTGWAWARNTPFRYYKQNQFEGGISTPAIFHWPRGLKTPPGSTTGQPAHLIDILPTVAAITDSSVPSHWPSRQLRPLSGVSLVPVFDGGTLGQRPPIHLLFSSDRGLRDGDWKLVSFRGEAWELYNMAADRTECNNLAESEPQRLASMSRTWTQMTQNVLHATRKHYAPVTAARLPHRHPQWTNFTDPQRRTKRSLPNHGIRARKNTRLHVVGRQLHLEFTGDDPGIAMDLRGSVLPPGPYRLAFRLLGGGKDDGEVFFTTDETTTLPKGKQIRFDIQPGDRWQDVSIPLHTTQSLRQLRIDVCNGPGEAKIEDLCLFGTSDRPLICWPATKSQSPASSD